MELSSLHWQPFFVYAMIPALRLVTQSIRRSRYLLIIVFQIFQMYVMSLIYIHGFKPYFIFVSLKSSPSGHHWIFHIYLSHKTARALNLTAYVFFSVSRISLFKFRQCRVHNKEFALFISKKSELQPLIIRVK